MKLRTVIGCGALMFGAALLYYWRIADNIHSVYTFGIGSLVTVLKIGASEAWFQLRNSYLIWAVAGAFALLLLFRHALPGGKISKFQDVHFFRSRPLTLIVDAESKTIRITSPKLEAPLVMPIADFELKTHQRSKTKAFTPTATGYTSKGDRFTIHNAGPTQVYQMPTGKSLVAIHARKEWQELVSVELPDARLPELEAVTRTINRLLGTDYETNAAQRKQALLDQYSEKPKGSGTGG